MRRQREVWLRKPVLRLLYNHWYARCVAQFSSEKPVVEIGAGSGNFKDYYRDVVSTDVFRSGPWVDVAMDAHALALARGKIGTVFAFDVLHHLQRPLDFLRQAIAALKPKGRLVLCEPALSPWSRFVYGVFHHEPIDTKWDLFGLDGTPMAEDRAQEFANAAIPELLFWTNRARTLQMLQPCRLVHARKFGFLLYPMTGGFGYRCFLPQTGFATLQKIEDGIFGPLAIRLTGMRMLVVLEKS
ncbi:MAG TPA: methyltransferase domain-containing protein [Candidatus Acidoferrales bacterium]|nr:methyltransferase domain-containing protein [Candidatus Acidoferrales bacterium]